MARLDRLTLDADARPAFDSRNGVSQFADEPLSEESVFRPREIRQAVTNLSTLPDCFHRSQAERLPLGEVIGGAQSFRLKLGLGSSVSVESWSRSRGRKPRDVSRLVPRRDEFPHDTVGPFH